jgi:2-polyprenyl-3-methyl-5-hydroxy-6-metoxy-1,4-benzoquinol methylase
LITISNIEFNKIKASRHEGRWVARSSNGKYFLKVQDLSVPIRQIYNLKQVDVIMRELLDKNAQCVPRIYDSGELKKNDLGLGNFFNDSTTLFYQIVEFIPRVKFIPYGDLFISLLELASLYVFPNDIKRNNLGQKNNRIYVLDYDQAIKLDGEIDMMSAQSSLIHLNFLQFNSLKFEIPGISKLDQYMYAATEKLNLAKLVRFKKQKSTRNKFNNYHKIDTSKLFAQGTRDLEERLKVLDKFNVNPNERVLDIGANLGLLSRYFENRGAIVDSTEIDFNTKSLGQSISIVENSSIEYIDLSDKKYKKKYHIVLLFSVLHHVDNYTVFARYLDSISDKILIECRLKESGKLLLSKWRWTNTNQWDFNSMTELESHLKDLFTNKNTIKFLGKSDKNRMIFELANFS